MNTLISHIRDKLQKSGSRSIDILNLLIERTDLMIVVTNDHGKVSECSQAFLRLFSLANEFQAGHFKQFLCDSSHYEYSKALDYIKRENKSVRNFSVNFNFSRRNGNMSLTLLPLNQPGKLNFDIVHLISPVSADADPQTNLVQIEKLTNVGQIAAGIAHELNTPLGSIILSAGNILESAVDNNVLKEAARIKNRAEHCSVVVKELLDYVRHSEKVRQYVRLSDRAARVKELISAECRQRNINVNLDASNDSIEIKCNVNQIEQVFFNLINNAIYAVDENGNIKIDIRYDSMLKRVVVSVHDDGSGIPADRIDKIFDPFYTTKPGPKGTGLGLAICKKIILEHGGDIEVSSKENIGTTFEFWLPHAED